MSPNDIDQRVNSLETNIASLRTDVTYIVKKLDELGSIVQTITRMEERHTSYANELDRLRNTVDKNQQDVVEKVSLNRTEHELLKNEIRDTRQLFDMWKNRAIGVFSAAAVLWTLFGGAIVYWITELLKASI